MCWSRFRCHIYGVGLYGSSDLRHARSEHLRDYWHDWWTHWRDGLEKGYLEVR